MAFHLALTVQSESYYPDEKSINHFFLFFFAYHMYTVSRCCLARARVTSPTSPTEPPERRLATPLALRINSHRSRPGLKAFMEGR